MAREEDKNSILGNRIRKARENIGKNQAEFAQMMGVLPTNLNRWEKGKVSPGWEYLAMIARYGNVSADWLLTGEGPMTRGQVAAAGRVAEPGQIASARDPLREEIIDVLDEIFIKEDRHLPPRKMEELIQLLYEELSAEESEEVRKGKILRFTRALAA